MINPSPIFIQDADSTRRAFLRQIGGISAGIAMSTGQRSTRKGECSMNDLWQISKPDRTYKHGIFINGQISVGIELPYVQCEQCGELKFSGRRLPFECPRIIRNEIESSEPKDGAWVVPKEAFQRLGRRWEVILRDLGHDVSLRPGDEFLPRRWNMPSKPRYDFYWHIYYNAVSERIVQLFAKHRVTGVTFYPLAFTKVGLVEPTDFARVPQEGDPDFFLDEFPADPDPAKYGPFYEMHYDNRSKPRPPQDAVTVTECAGCGRQRFEESNLYKRHVGYLRKSHMLPKRYTFDTDIFFTHVRTGFVINEKVRSLLSDEHLRNCIVTPVTVVDD